MSDSDMYDDMKEMTEKMFENPNTPNMYMINITGMSQNERRILFVKNRIKEIETEEKNKYNNKLLLKFKNELIELKKK